jgi:hypothetical protein
MSPAQARPTRLWSTTATIATMVAHQTSKQYGTLLAEPIVISDSENEDASPRYVPNDWPPLVKYWAKNKTPDKIKFISLDFGKCTCSRSCSTTDCLNAKSAIYCSRANCKVGPNCGNRLQDLKSLRMCGASKDLES